MLILTVVYTSENRKRFSTRAMSSHVTLAELLAWAQENCGESEEVDSVSFRAERQHVEPHRPIPLDQFEVKRLSHRLFH